MHSNIYLHRCTVRVHLAHAPLPDDAPYDESALWGGVRGVHNEVWRLLEMPGLQEFAISAEHNFLFTQANAEVCVSACACVCTPLCACVSVVG